MPETKTYRVPLSKLEEVRALLNHGVHRISSQVVHDRSTDWCECEVVPGDVETEIISMGGVTM